MSYPIQVGKISTFGGPNDSGMSANEGLAFLTSNDINNPHYAGMWLPQQPNGKPGLSHRLNPDSYYIAMRWNYHDTPISKLKTGYVLVTNSAGKSVKALPADWGPNINTGRLCDLSPGVANALGLKTDDTVSCQFFE